jgi:hypothetical protein
MTDNRQNGMMHDVYARIGMKHESGRVFGHKRFQKLYQAGMTRHDPNQ